MNTEEAAFAASILLFAIVGLLCEFKRAKDTKPLPKPSKDCQRTYTEYQGKV